MELSQEQKYAFNQFTQNQNLFITGPGGTGKTKLIDDFVKNCKERGKTVQVCALTGCATLLLPKNVKAKTIHSWSGIRLCKGENKFIISNALKNRHVKSAWRKVQVLIVDEVSMMSVKMLEVLDQIAKSARMNNSPFGGIQVVFVGDFYQLPPVGTAGDPDTDRFCFESVLWSRIFSRKSHIELKTIFRQSDPKYKEILSQIRTDTLTDSNIEVLKGYVNREYDPSKYNGCIPPKLYPTRVKSDYLNKLMFSKLEGKEYEFECIIKTSCKTLIESNKPLSTANLERGRALTPNEIQYEVTQLMNTSSFQETLNLKVNSVVMCTVNLDIDNGICNGSQGIITEFIETVEGEIPVVKFTNGLKKQLLPHYIQSDEYPSIAVGQIPLCLSWAMTIHKIQGATMPMASIDVGGQIFECGQTYVALSRVQSLDGLYLTAFHAHKIRTNERVIRFYEDFPVLDYEIPENPNSNANENPFDQYKCEELREEEIVVSDPTIKRIIL
jgi:ATP-dependent DNA helicase PIF1